ncbi:MAG: TIGR01458 family HAD-type hydrolase [Candidatus Nezhaarchaeales archaeon]
MKALSNIKGFLIDLEGTLHIGDQSIKGAVETIDFLRSKGYSIRFITNTTRRCRKTICERLSKLGFKISEREVFSAPIAAIRYIKKRSEELGLEPTCYLLYTGDVHRDFEESGLILTDEKPNFVVVGDAGENFTHTALTKAFRLLLEGAELIAMEKDRYWKSQAGLELGAGPFVVALEYASGKNAVLVGKPSRDFFMSVLADMNVKPEEAAIIGDDVNSDIGGGKAIGMKGILVKTGKYREEDLRKASVKPDVIIPSISSLMNLLT